MAQVCRAPTETDSSDAKQINPFSIENILKSEPPSPPSCSDSGDEVSDNSESNPPSNHVLVTPQVALWLYQSQVQNYWHYLLVNNLAQQQGKTADKKLQAFKEVILPVTHVSPVVKAENNTLFSGKSSLRGTKRHDMITPSTEKKIKLDLYMKEHSQPDRPVLTREEYKLKCTKALPILHNSESLSNENALSPKTFLEMVDINKVLNLSVTDLNVIIDNATFSDEERAYIRELRRKAMNKKAAEECRRRKKSEEQHLTEEYDSLRSIRRQLFSDKEQIELEIKSMKETVGELPPETEDTLHDPSSPPPHTPTDTTHSPLN